MAVNHMYIYCKRHVLFMYTSCSVLVRYVQDINKYNTIFCNHLSNVQQIPVASSPTS